MYKVVVELEVSELTTLINELSAAIKNDTAIVDSPKYDICKKDVAEHHMRKLSVLRDKLMDITEDQVKQEK